MGSPKEEDFDATIIGTRAETDGLKKSVASLVIVQGADIGKQFLIRRNSLIIGRADGADIMLRDKRISRFHARIDIQYELQKQKTSYSIVDLDSTNHVYVNGKQIQSRMLSNDDKIQCYDHSHLMKTPAWSLKKNNDKVRIDAAKLNNPRRVAARPVEMKKAASKVE